MSILFDYLINSKWSVLRAKLVRPPDNRVLCVHSVIISSANTVISAVLPSFFISRM